MFRRLHGLLEISGGVRKTQPAIDQWGSEKAVELQTCATEGDACSGGYTAC